MNKKFLLGLLMASTATTIYAQPTLTKATNNPVVGDNYYGYMLDTVGVSKGASGASVTWNMSAVIKNDSDTTSYFTCAATPYCDSFSGANIVMLNAGDYAYGVSGTSGIDLIGAYSSGSYLHFTNNSTLTHFPLSYGASFNDTFTFNLSEMGADIYVKGISTSDCDAWGTLILPTGTYNNVLRVHTTMVLQDSINFMGFPNVDLTQTETYNWYVAGFHSPLLTISYDTSGLGTPYVSDAKYFKGNMSSGVNDINKQNTSLDMYPNPANDNINFKFSAASAGTATLSILNMTGQVVSVVNIDRVKTGINEVNVPVSTLANGVYMVRIQGSGAPVSARFTIVK